MDKRKNMDKRKPWSKKSSSDEVHWRAKYMDPSQRFLDFVRDLGFGHSLFGRLLSYVDDVVGLKAWSSIFIFCLILSFLIFWDVDVNHQIYLGDVATSE